jgi:rubrerythrin
MYTIHDIIDKLIIIEKHAHEFYRSVSENPQIDIKVAVVAKAFSSQEQKHIKIYESLKENFDEEENTFIDFSIYDRAAKLIYEFTKMQNMQNITRLKEIIDFALNFEKENLALILSIKGLLIRSQNDVDTANYKVLLSIIEEEQKHIKDIESIST